MKRNTITAMSSLALTVVALTVSCVTTKVANKSGTQLWSENCQRCHNAPSGSFFSNAQWEIINAHMRQRANLTEEEYKKITEFLKGE
jgi:hypothetical protein